ncbi:MAG TPA: signal recognition particle protein [Steroidobacteraceae bacterium]|nr:signal recognition particle protein [Steroidobacteraceae bacterium]
MFEQLSQRLQGVLEGLRGRGRLTDENIADALRQVRMALLEADVALPVVKSFIDGVRAKAVGLEVDRSLTPGQAFIRLIHDELVATMGEGARSLDLRVQPPAVILLAGLQGAGKTTTAGKLAGWLREHERKKVMLVSTDVYRPAAILQLERLAAQLGVGFAAADPARPPVEIARGALAEARRSVADVLIVDTAGRLHVDTDMMQEVREIAAAVDPIETLFVVDSMAGQDAVNAARAFGEALDLTGVILTKADGDARGGAALSVRHVTGRPILFVGTGEKIDAIEPFDPKRIASRVLGMGDVLSLVEDVTRKVDRAQAEKLARKLQKGRDFDLNDLHDQLGQIQQLGGLGALMEKLPTRMFGKAVPQAAPDDREVRRQLAIIRSMTAAERRFPKTIDASRKRRIAAGSGVQVADVNRLLKSFLQMQKMMKSMSGKGGMSRLMRGLGGRMPPGGGPFGPA